MKCEHCRYMFHLKNKHSRPRTMFCSIAKAKNQYCVTANAGNKCKKFEHEAFDNDKRYAIPKLH